MTSPQIEPSAEHHGDPSKEAHEEIRDSEKALISVVLPIYNREKTLHQAINSVRAQIFEDWELICVDDGSSDDSAAIVEEYCAIDSRITFFQIDHCGVAGARNKALLEAKGQIISYLDSDNTWRCNYLYDVWNTLRGQVGVSCYSAMRVNILDSDEKLLRQSTLLQKFDRRSILRRNQIDMNTFSHSRDLVAAHGPFDEQMTRLCDWELILRYTSEKAPIRIDSIGADYYHHRSENRVSMNANYAPNRLTISLKSHPTQELRAVYVTNNSAEAHLTSFESAGFPVVVLAKDDFFEFQLRAADFVFWHGCEWDSDQNKMTEAAVKMEFDCTFSCYLLPKKSANTLVSLSTFNRLHFVVCESQEHKQDFQQYIFALQQANKQVDVNPLDRILVQHCSEDPTHCLTDFCQTIVTHQQLEPSQGFDLWLDQSAAPKHIQRISELAADLDPEFKLKKGRDAPAVQRNGKLHIDRFNSGIVVYATSHSVPNIPAKDGLPRLLLVLGDDTGLDPARISQFDALLFDTAQTAAAYAKEYPMLRTYCYESPTTLQLARLVRTALGDLFAIKAMNLPKHELPRITYLAGNDGAGSTRKRCYEMASTIEAIFPLQIVAQKKFEMRFLVGSDVVIVQRWVERYGESLEDFFHAVGQLKLAGKTFIYDLDDHVLDYSQGLPKTFLSISDRVSCSTPYLQQRLSRFHSNTYVAANLIDTKTLSLPSLHRPKRTRQIICVSTDGMGYETICEIAKNVHNAIADSIEFLFVSAVELAPNDHVNRVGHLNWEQLFELMCDCELMLNLNEMSAQLDARLSGDGQLQYDREAFIHSKSAIKYHDSALAGIPLITSNAPQQFVDWIDQGITGIVVENHEDMLAHLLRLLHDPDAAASIARNARADVLRNHTAAAHWEGLAKRMIESYSVAEKFAHNWHQEDLSTLSDALIHKKSNAARYARMLELGAEGAQRATRKQDQKRLEQIQIEVQKTERQVRLTENEKRKVASLERQLSSKELARQKAQTDLELTLQRLSHYQQPLIKRLIDAIKFRLNKH